MSLVLQNEMVTSAICDQVASLTCAKKHDLKIESRM